MDFEITEELPTKSVAELKQEFYQSMIIPPSELRPEFRGEGQFIWRPNALILNPVGWGSKDDPSQPDIYIAVYYRGYYVRVQCGRTVLTGPHKFELCYQARLGCHVLLGCWLSEFMFFNERILRKKLKKGILFNKYYASPKAEEFLVEIGQPSKPEVESV